MKSLLLNGILFVSMQVNRKLKKTTTNVKKGDLYYSRNCKHAKNHKLFVFHNRQIVASQLGNGDVREMGRKVVQFATILHFL